MTYQTYKTLLLDKKDQITTLTLNRPQKKNAMNPTMMYELSDALTEVEQDDDCRVLVITGAGDSFTSGLDLQEFFYDTEGKPAERQAARKATFNWMYRHLKVLPKPTIAKVNGWSFGGGVVTTCLCDFAVASETATFGLSEVNWGILPAGGATKLASMLVNPRDALYMVMSGKPFDGKRAAEMRLVNFAVPAAELDAATLKLAEEFKEKNPAVLAACKEAFRVGLSMGLEDAVAWERAMWWELDALGGKTWKKGVKQFREDKSYRPGLGAYKWDK